MCRADTLPRHRFLEHDKPTGLGHAGLDAGGARPGAARISDLIWEGRPPELPGADAV